MLTKFLNNYGYMILGGAMIIGLSAFKEAEAYAGKSLDPVMVYFHGDPTDDDQVKDPSEWTTTSNSQSCDVNYNEQACAIEVDESDLNANNGLEGTRIELGGTSTREGYIPSRTGGTSPTPFKPINKQLL